MSLDGLNYLLEKNEVVSTASALDLIERPEGIETGYLRHVRTFIPISRYAEGNAFGVKEFEARLIKRTREGKAPRGYIAAGYGYGKTSTSLYLWQQAEAANLLTVPPFQLEKLHHLIEALYGWAHYCLGKKRPSLIPDLDAAYEQVSNRSLEGMAQKHAITVEAASSLLASGSLNLEIQPNDYVNFFDAVTTIALRAGYSGVILIADEIQQFIRPRREGRVDTISPLFNIIQLLGTREPDASLHFGFLISITLEEIAMIRDTYKRGDLLARLKELSLDLTDLYDISFARMLWERMAETFEFTTESHLVIDDSMLDALGNISANKTISDGPRTVVNVLKRAVSVYLERRDQGDLRPYSPIDMIDDFLDERIYFKGNDKVPSVARRMLAHPFVARNPARYAPAIKLIAAFGVQGVSQSAQTYYGQTEAINELMEKGIGEIVRIGSNLAERSVALVGLDPDTDTTWMKETIRNFRLGWNPHSRESKDRAFSAFTTLLTERVFPKAKTITDHSANMVANHALILEMDVVGDKGKRYPKRRVHIRLYWDEEPLKDAGIDGDVCLEYRLNSYDRIPADQRALYAESAYEAAEKHTVTIPLNVGYKPENAVERPLYDQLKDVWSPYDLSPIILLNLYQLMIDLKQSGNMPKNEMSFIESTYLPEFLDFAMSDLFNEVVGANLQSAGAEISLISLRYLLNKRYPDYVTLMVNSTWATSVAKYIVALERLDNPLMRQGNEDVIADKTEIAGKFTLSNTGFDTFLATFGTLITVTRDFGGKQSGVVRFTLHPLESLILEWLRASDQTIPSGKQTARRIARAQVIRWAGDVGYQSEEIEKALELLKAREIITSTPDWIIEAINEALSLDGLKADLRQHTDEINVLVAAFSGEQGRSFQSNISRISEALDKELRAKNPDSVQLSKIANTLKKSRADVAAFAKDRRSDLAQRLAKVSVNALRENEMILLQQPMDDDIDYVDMVNMLRTKLLDVIDKTQRQVADHESEIGRTRDILRPDVAISQLGEIVSMLKKLEADQSALQTAVSAAREKFSHYERWRALVKTGANLMNMLHDLRLEGEKAVVEQMKDLIMGIRAEISSRKLDALTVHQQFTVKLDAISRDLYGLRQNARAEFNLQRDNFAQLLQLMEIKPDTNLTNLAFNPSDPAHAYMLMYNLVRSQFTKALAELQGVINARQQTIQVLQRQAAHLPSRESRSLQNNADEIGTLLRQLQERTVQLHNNLTLLTTDELLLQSAKAFADDYRTARADASSLHQDLERLRRSVTQLEPNPQESRLRDCLTQLITDTESVGAIDVFTLQRSYADDETFWAALRGLLEKDCIMLNATLPSGGFAVSES